MFVFILSQKKAIFYQCSLKKHLEPEAGKKIRHRTPTPKPDTDAESEPDELVDLGGTEQLFRNWGAGWAKNGKELGHLPANEQ